MTASLTRRAARASGWRAAKRLLKATPVVGTALAIGLVGYEIKKKARLPGAVHTGLASVPFVGTAKGVIELFTGDLIKDKESEGG